MSNISDFAVFVIYIYLAVVVVFIIMENRDTSSTLAWILIFLLFPIIGFFVYIFFGRNWKVTSPQKKDRIKRIHEETDAMLSRIKKEQEHYIDSFKNSVFMQSMERILRVSQKNSDAFLSLHNKVRILYSGTEKFALLEKDLQNAKQFIHMEYFIWRDDVLTRHIRDILIKKAKEGVVVRIIYDPIGSLGTVLFHWKYFREMRRSGIIIIPFFNSLSPLKITTINYLLHRKIVVIDGSIGYTGGMNMGQEYIDGGKYDQWHDTHVRLEGDAVLLLHTAFAANWEEVRKESLFKNEYFPRKRSYEKEKMPVQIISSEPNSYWQPIKQALFAMISDAKDHVYIQTPYFIPDVNLFEALKVIALTGVDVRVMVTGIVDKKLPYWAAFTYFEELLLAGVKIYHYNKGFLHAKTISVDGIMCSIGTTNMDIRSLHLSHENNVIIYDDATVLEFEDRFIDDVKKCALFTIEDYKKISVFAKFRNSSVRLLSPLL